MLREHFTEEKRWKNLIPSEAPRFPKSIQFRNVDAKPPKEVLIKLFDNAIYDIILEKFETAEGLIEIRMYLNFKRNIRKHIATMIGGIWQINELNRYNEFATFGQIYKKYEKHVEKALIKICDEPKQSKTNFKRQFDIFVKRTIKKYF